MAAASPAIVTHRRRCFIAGDQKAASEVRRQLTIFDFLILADGIPGDQTSGLQFLVLAYDDVRPHLTKLAADDLAKARARCDMGTQAVLYVHSSAQLTQELVLWALEVGFRFAAVGPDRTRDLRQYFKRVCLEAEQRGTFAFYEEEFTKLGPLADRAGLESLCAKILDTHRDHTEGLKLLVRINGILGRPQKQEHYLRRVLQLNDQDLWAANALARDYIKQRKIEAALEVFERLSQFHDLDWERLILHGQTLLAVGDFKNAERVFLRGTAIDAQDPRLTSGIVSAQLGQGQYETAATSLGGRGCPLDVIAFLNMRAILAIRQGNTDKGIQYYQFALARGELEELTQAKLSFNMGLGYVKAGNIEDARKCFDESLRLGGRKFRRAEKPLEILAKIGTGGRTAAQAAKIIEADVEVDLEHEIEREGMHTAKAKIAG